jgi:hypothetical protein
MTTATTDPDFLRRRRRGRLTLLMLAAIFIGPLAVAFLLYYGEVWRPEGMAVNGELIEPARMLPTAPLADTVGGRTIVLERVWTLLVIAPAPCDEACRGTLVETRQMRRALGKELDRVQRVWLVSAGQPDGAFVGAEHPELLVLGSAAPGREALLQAIGPVVPGEILVVDPHGNLMMRFPPGTSMRAMHTDMKRLLKVSRIG